MKKTHEIKVYCDGVAVAEKSRAGTAIIVMPLEVFESQLAALGWTPPDRGGDITDADITRAFDLIAATGMTAGAIGQCLGLATQTVRAIKAGQIKIKPEYRRALMGIVAQQKRIAKYFADAKK